MLISQTPRRVLWISSDRDDQMEAEKSKAKKIPRVSNKTPKKSLDQTLTPQKSHAKFPSNKNFRKH